MNIFLYDQIKGDEAEKELFKKKLIKYAQMLNTDPNWIMLVMYFESRLNPAAVNSITGATGLIQFMPSTAAGLGTSTTALKEMEGSRQLDYVYLYLKKYVGKLKSLTDVYLTVFYPYAVGKPDTYILGSQVSEGNSKTIAEQNAIFDIDKNGKLNKAEVTAYITAWAKKQGYTGDLTETPQKKN